MRNKLIALQQDAILCSLRAGYSPCSRFQTVLKRARAKSGSIAMDAFAMPFSLLFALIAGNPCSVLPDLAVTLA